MLVADPQRSKAFYQTAFDAPVVHEDANSVVFTFDNLLINLLALPAAHELIAPAIVAGGEAGARYQLTIWVDDVDARCAELAQRGIALINGPMNRIWGQRTACFADPDGHLWELAQALS